MHAPRRLTTPILALLAVFAVLAAACGNDDDGATGPGTTAAGETDGGQTDGELGATAPGVTEDTITIAYTYLDFDLLVEMGLSPAGWGDQELAFQSLVDDINAEGGINGRQLEVIYEAYSPLGTEDAEAVCLRVTQDNEVFAVVGGFLGPAEPANTCIAGQQSTILVGGVQSDERLGEARAPWITDRPLRTRQAEIMLSLLDQEGMIEGKSVALITNIDAQDVRDAVRDTLADFDVEPVEDLLLDAPIGDIAAEDAAWSPVAERLRGSAADVVMVVGNPSSAVRNLRSQGLDVELWVLDQEALRALGATVNIEDARGALSSAPLTGQPLWDDDTVSECREIFTDANPDVDIIEPEDLEEGDDNWVQGIVTGCRFLRLFQEVATAAGPELTQDSFREAAAGMGKFTIPGQRFASLGPDKHDSNDSFQLVEFNPDLGSDGDYDALTEIADATP
jgi:ABC-type branched-subunit amino acid transport system substrate-binding protein